MAEWEGNGGWFRWDTPIGRYAIAEVFGGWLADSFAGNFGVHPTRADAEQACIDHATGIWRDLGRALGQPDDAAVERACDCWNKATSTFMPDDADYVAEMRSDMRDALTAAMGGE
jgi:hypothetical protein